MKHNLHNVAIHCRRWFWSVALISILAWLPRWSNAQDLTSSTIAGGKGQGSAANQLNHPAGLFINAASAVFVVDSDNHRVQKFAYDFSTRTYASSGETVAGGNGAGAGTNQLNHPEGIFQDAPGNLYVADSENHRVQKFIYDPITRTFATQAITIAGGNGAGLAANQLNHPSGLFVNVAGAVYVVDSDNHRVQKFAYNLSMQTYAGSGETVAGGNGAGSGARQLNTPKGIYQDVPGNLFVADSKNHRLQKFALGSLTGETVAGGNGAGDAANQLSSPMDVFVDLANNLYVTDSGNHRVQKFPRGETVGLTLAGGPGSAANQLNGPTGIYQNQAGDVFVADSENHRVQQFSPKFRPIGFAILSVKMVSCALISPANPNEYSVSFTPEYQDTDGSTITFQAINEALPTTALGPYTLPLYRDNPVIMLTARQASGAKASYRFAWLTACEGGNSPNRPPTTAGIPNQITPQGQAYRLDLSNYFSDPEGQQLTYSATNIPAGLVLDGSIITGRPTAMDVYPIRVTALDPGGFSAQATFSLTVTPMPPVGNSLAIVGVNLADCKTLTPNTRQLTLIPVYSGGDGSAITFRIVNETLPTTLPGPYSLRLYLDNPAITLAATQSAKPEIRFQYNWRAACSAPSGAGRLGATDGELAGSLSVRLLGNPVLNQQINVEITGAEGQALRLELLNMNGQTLNNQSVPQAGKVERQILNLSGQQPGFLLLRVSTAIQSRTVKILNAE